MRNLTLGVLIVSAGTFAALPFRRQHPPVEVPPGPVQADGPTLAAVESQDLQLLTSSQLRPVGAVASNASDGKHAGLPSDPTSGNGTKLCDANEWEQADSYASLWSQRQSIRPQNQTFTPLTYDDLAVPLSTPAIVQERFNATAGVNQISQLDAAEASSQALAAGDSFQKIANEPTLGGNQEENLRERQSVTSDSMFAGKTPPTPPRNATFVSTPRQNAEPDLPATIKPDPTRQRFWIRQPD